MVKKRVRVPVRFDQARKDARIGSLERTIERDYGLPAGSICIVAPCGRNVRSDSTVDAMRRLHS